MNDYKELIAELDVWQKDAENCELVPPNVFRKCKYVIEQLVRERDAAVEDLNWAKPCSACKQQGLCVKGSWTDSSKCPFEWRGVQNEID